MLTINEIKIYVRFACCYHHHRHVSRALYIKKAIYSVFKITYYLLLTYLHIIEYARETVYYLDCFFLLLLVPAVQQQKWSSSKSTTLVYTVQHL